MIISGDYKVLLTGDEAFVEYLHEWCSICAITERNLYMNHHNTSGHGCLILTIYYDFFYMKRVCRRFRHIYQDKIASKLMKHK